MLLDVTVGMNYGNPSIFEIIIIVGAMIFGIVNVCYLIYKKKKRNTSQGNIEDKCRTSENIR